VGCLGASISAVAIACTIDDLRQCVAMRCRVVQSVALCFRVLQRVAVCCNILPSIAEGCLEASASAVAIVCTIDVLRQCVAVCCDVLQCVAEWYSVLQRSAEYYSVLQCVAEYCKVLQCVVWKRLLKLSRAPLDDLYQRVAMQCRAGHRVAERWRVKCRVVKNVTVYYRVLQSVI